MPVAAVLDACVLYPIHLVDTLLRCAEVNLYRPLWSPDIFAELRRALVHQAHLTEREADRRIDDMKRSFPKSMIEGYHPRIPQLANHPKDRHVLAVAVQSRADLIVTANLRHFPPTALAPFNITAEKPDTFLRDLLHAEPTLMTSVIQQQVKGHTDPPIDVAELLARLEVTVPQFSDEVRARLLADQL